MLLRSMKEWCWSWKHMGAKYRLSPILVDTNRQTLGQVGCRLKIKACLSRDDLYAADSESNWLICFSNLLRIGQILSIILSQPDSCLHKLMAGNKGSVMFKWLHHQIHHLATDGLFFLMNLKWIDKTVKWSLRVQLNKYNLSCNFHSFETKKLSFLHCRVAFADHLLEKLLLALYLTCKLDCTLECFHCPRER